MKNLVLKVVCCICVVLSVTVIANEMNLSEFVDAEFAGAIESINLPELPQINEKFLSHKESYIWEDIGWVLNRQEFYQYDNDGKPLALVRKQLIDGIMTRTDSLVLEYNGSGKESSETSFIWVDISWQPAEKTLFVYNENDNIKEKSEWEWIFGDSKWLELSKIIYQYDESENLIERLYQRLVDQEMQNSQRNRNLYDQENRIIESWKDIWQDGAWVPMAAYKYEYTDTGLPLSETLFRVVDDDSLEVYSKSFYTFNEWDNPVTMTSQMAVDNEWQNSRRVLIEYDENQYRVKMTSQRFDEDWVNYSQITCINNQAGERLEEIMWTWDGENWVHVMKNNYFYMFPTAVHESGDAVALSFTVGAYPNPFNASTKISFRLPQPGRISVEIFNVNGKRVKTLLSNQMLQNGQHEYSWNGTNDNGMPVATGIYLVRTSIDNASVLKRITMIK